jgi:hypothetical protein
MTLIHLAPPGPPPGSGSSSLSEPPLLARPSSRDVTVPFVVVGLRALAARFVEHQAEDLGHVEPGEGALDRILRETSSHYLLGVEPTDEDRGRLRELRVKVSQPGVTVRSRLWVSVPKKRTL